METSTGAFLPTNPAQTFRVPKPPFLNGGTERAEQVASIPVSAGQSNRPETYAFATGVAP
jgi:hypothetical protein